MSEHKHTPGVWRVVDLGDHSISSDAHYMESMGVGLNDGYPLAIVISRRAVASRIEANARLIAAAPELLAALTGMIDMYVELVESGDAGFWDAEKVREVIAARAAIAKATGGSS